MESQRLSDVRRIVLVATHWLGDTFWALQTVPFLQRQHPHAVIHLLVRDSLRWLARAWLPETQLFATRGLVSDRRRESLWRSLRLGEDLAQLRRHQPPIDLLIDYTNTRATALLTLALRPARSIGAGMASGSRLYSSWRDARSFERHLAERPWWILAPHYRESAGWPTPPEQRRPRLPERAVELPADPVARDAPGDPSVGREILAFPGGGWREKRWPLDCWIDLAHDLEKRGLGVALLFSPEESSACRQARAALADAAACGVSATGVSCRVTRGAELVGHLSAARGVVANDSGAAHLAAALEVPTVALFGPTNPRICGPRGPHVRIVRARCAQRPEGVQHHCHETPAYRCDREGLRDVSVAQVCAALSELGIGGAATWEHPERPSRPTETSCGS